MDCSNPFICWVFPVFPHHESHVHDFICHENAFVLPQCDIVLVQAIKYLLNSIEMCFVIRGCNQNVINMTHHMQ